jgi:hypothetical protein
MSFKCDDKVYNATLKFGLFLWALMMAMSTPTSQAAKRLPAVHPDAAKTLTTIALCKPVLGSLSFNLYDCVVNLKISGAL